MTARLHFYCII